MKAVVFRDGRAVAIEERPEPEPGPEETLVRAEYCGICGTDLRATRLEGLFAPGVVMGHEFAGEVVALGPDVGRWSPGDRVTVNPNSAVCGACRECRSGRTNLCRVGKTRSVGVKRDGGMAPYVNLPVAVLHRLPDGVTTRQGAWVEPLAVALRVVRVSEFRVGGSAVVLGGWAHRAAHAAGASPRRRQPHSGRGAFVAASPDGHALRSRPYNRPDR